MGFQRANAEPLDAEGLYRQAVKALARRPRTVAELRRLLEKRARAPKELEAAMARLTEHGYVDDGRLAESHARYQKEIAHHGPGRVIRDLRARGVAEATAAAAVQRGFAGIREEQLLKAHIQKKRQRRPESWAEAARLYRGWLRAGFGAAACRQCLRQWKVDRDWLEALELADASEGAEAET